MYSFYIFQKRRKMLELSNIGTSSKKLFKQWSGVDLDQCNQFKS